MKTIDIHAHVVPRSAWKAAEAKRDWYGYRYEAGDGAGAFVSSAGKRIPFSSPKVRLTPDERLKDMDAQGVDVQVVSPGPMQYFYWTEPDMGRTLARMVNDDLAALCAKHPERLVPMGTVPLQDAQMAAAELDRVRREHGMRAVEVSTNVNGKELSDPSLAPFWAKAEQLGMLVFLHPLGFTEGKRLSRHHFNNVIGNPLESAIAVGYLIYDGVLDRHPGLKICVAHGGGYAAHYIGRFDHAWTARPEDRGAIAKKPSEYMKRLYFDTVQYEPVEVEHLVRRWGAEHVIMGTDWPYAMGEADPVGLLHRCSGLSDSERDRIAGLNAAELLGIKFETTAKARTDA
jgi:aminocarboxymuconate-semialdehyde decarboxylase